MAKIDGMIVGQCQVYHIHVGYSNPTHHGPAGINELALLSVFFFFFSSVSFKMLNEKKKYLVKAVRKNKQ